MMRNWPQRALLAIYLVALGLDCSAQRVSRPDPSDPAHPFNTPAPVSLPATERQFSVWRSQAREALFLPSTPPAVAARSFGSFTPMPGVVARRVTFGTEYG